MGAWLSAGNEMAKGRPRCNAALDTAAIAVNLNTDRSSPGE
jgi:hypothetical protein